MYNRTGHDSRAKRICYERTSSIHGSSTAVCAYARVCTTLSTFTATTADATDRTTALGPTSAATATTAAAADTYIKFYSVSSVNSDECGKATATAATYNSLTEGLALYADSNNMFNDDPAIGTSRSCLHTLMSNHTAAAAAGAQDSFTAFAAADNIDDAWSSTIDPVLQSLWGTSQHEQQHVENAESDNSDCCNSMLNEPLADDTPATFTDVDMTSDAPDCIDSMHCAVSNTDSSSSSSSSSGDSTVPLLKLVQWTDVVNTNRSAKADAADTHTSATAGVADIGTDAQRSNSQAYHNEQTMPQFIGSCHNTATVHAQAHTGSSTVTAATAAADADDTVDRHGESVYATCDNVSANLGSIGMHMPGKVTLPYTCDDTENSSSSNSSTQCKASSSNSADDVVLDNQLARALTLIKLKSQAGYYTDSNRSQQAIAHIQKWNAIRHGEVSVKLALLKFWCKSGHIDEQFRAQQAKLAWDSYAYSKWRSTACVHIATSMHTSVAAHITARVTVYEQHIKLYG
eukprot:4497-Heterococcus_DN1.PRE.3